MWVKRIETFYICKWNKRCDGVEEESIHGVSYLHDIILEYEPIRQKCCSTASTTTHAGSSQSHPAMTFNKALISGLFGKVHPLSVSSWCVVRDAFLYLVITGSIGGYRPGLTTIIYTWNPAAYATLPQSHSGVTLIFKPNWGSTSLPRGASCLWCLLLCIYNVIRCLCFDVV